MLKINKTVLPSPEQWEIIIEGMRNPMNSWDKSDSEYEWVEDPSPINPNDPGMMFVIGTNDHQLMMNLAKGGSVHAKYRRMIPVFLTINAPLYWWKEFDTYKVGTVCNSCSTMHKIHSKEFTLDDFSCEQLVLTRDGWVTDNNGQKWCDPLTTIETLKNTLNACRDLYLKTKDKTWWWQMIQLLPTSYNQKRTIMLNYEVLVGIYRDRKNHKLDEWHVFCDWIRSLPYSELITGGEEDE